MQRAIAIRDGQQLQQAVLDDTCLCLVSVLAIQARQLGVSHQPHMVELNIQRARPARDDLFEWLDGLGVSPSAAQASAESCATIEFGKASRRPPLVRPIGLEEANRLTRSAAAPFPAGP